MSATNIGIMTLPAGTALEPYRRLKISSNTWVYAGLGEDHVATSQDAYASGDDAIGNLQSLPDVFKLSMATTCSAGDTIYGAANGQGSTTKSGPPIGTAKLAVTAANGVAEIIKLMPEPSKRTWTVKGGTGGAAFTLNHPFPASPLVGIVQVWTAAGAPRAITSAVWSATQVVVTPAANAADDVYAIMAFDSSDISA